MEFEDGIDRRGFLKCMAWAGSGVLYTVSGGILRSQPLSELARNGDGKFADAEIASFRFVQISDSHIGFSKDANKDVIGTLQAAVNGINSGARPDLLLHTGDLSHLSKPEEFDALERVLQGVRCDRHFVPGEHDVLDETGANFLQRYAKNGPGWYSFDHKGVHFIGLVNVLDLKAGGLGNLGDKQLAWLADDVRGRSSSTPIVVFAHVPLWTVYPQWGWGTDDGARALELLKRFGSVSVLNGHIHQIMQKVEGSVTFHTANSTAFPQPKPGEAAGPGPMKVSPDMLPSLLGITDVNFVVNRGPLAIVDRTLGSFAASRDGYDVRIDNFTFNPMVVTAPIGATVRWENRDDIPHTVVATDGAWRSRALDTGDRYERRFETKGTFAYYCSVHPRMEGKVIIR